METFKEDISFQCTFFEQLAQKCTRDVVVLQRLGEIYSSIGRLEDGLRTDIRASFLAPEDPHVHYNLACSFARSGQPRFALDHLKLAMHFGFDDPGWLQKDDDLATLHHLAEFKSLVRDLQRRHPGE
ncbi:MAG: hypothetical protein LBS68_01865 [Puniceicoccales bacterium]|nr:hypothetical protein [Puniceicoccales bacterium]